MGQMMGFLFIEGCEHKALWNLRYANMEVTALNWRRQNLEFPFCFFPVFSVETRKEGFSSHTTRQQENVH